MHFNKCLTVSEQKAKCSFLENHVRKILPDNIKKYHHWAFWNFTLGSHVRYKNTKYLVSNFRVKKHKKIITKVPGVQTRKQKKRTITEMVKGELNKPCCL